MKLLEVIAVILAFGFILALYFMASGWDMIGEIMTLI